MLQPRRVGRHDDERRRRLALPDQDVKDDIGGVDAFAQSFQAGGLDRGQPVTQHGRGDRHHVRANVEERFELAAIAGLVAGEVTVERQAVEVALDVDLGAEAAERLALLPPFAPAAEICARIEVLSNIWMMPAVRLQLASTRKKASKVPFCDNRQNRLQTVLHGPNSAGSARQVMLCNVK